MDQTQRLSTPYTVPTPPDAHDPMVLEGKLEDRLTDERDAALCARVLTDLLDCPDDLR